ncbi:hypothetical protein CLV98_11130 [Dyadobacter jejuensis]|uniref:Uncharacterized protein n=1 Tax=Dyadobacter jejuensis TaxID=1082580 RepID=A0A316AFH3_9BACT|nr:hypothetical protein CLV98_11130 [Dyadobacter jejuensis]
MLRKLLWQFLWHEHKYNMQLSEFDSLQEGLRMIERAIGGLKSLKGAWRSCPKPSSVFSKTAIFYPHLV